MNTTNDFWLIDSNCVGVMHFYIDRDNSDKSIDYMFIEAGIRFIILLIIFGVTNYFMMLRRYENHNKKKKYLQQEKISRLYPKGSFIF